jgi:hypothetical protein
MIKLLLLGRPGPRGRQGPHIGPPLGCAVPFITVSPCRKENYRDRIKKLIQKSGKYCIY